VKTPTKTLLNAPVPVLAVSGWSGSGKTTLLEAVIPALVQRGLAVALLKHDAHGLDVDREGKDSDRLFRAGADVVVDGPGESFTRRRPSKEWIQTRSAWWQLAPHHDVLLVEGRKHSPFPKIWLSTPDKPTPPDDVVSIIGELAWTDDRPARFLELFDSWIRSAWLDREIWGGVLTGGASRRMGCDKASLIYRGKPFARHVTDALLTICKDRRRILALGAAVEGCRTIHDPPGVRGPLAGMLGALRWHPSAAWLVSACDQPLVSENALRWLLDQRAPGRWVIMPRARDGRMMPMPAVYEPQAAVLAEDLLEAGRLAPREMASHPKVYSPTPPAELLSAWANINTPEDLEALKRRGDAISQRASRISGYDGGDDDSR